MAERSSGKKSTSGTTLDLMGEEEPAPPRAARKATAPAPAVQAVPSGGGGALFGGDEVDLDARHPADVPVGNFPAPSQIAQVDEDGADPFAEDDPFEDTVMARMLADEPAPLSSPLRAAREEFNLRTDEEAPAEELPMEEAPAPIMEAVAEPVIEDSVIEDSVIKAIAEPDLEAFADPVAVPEVEQKIEIEQEQLMPIATIAPPTKTPAAPKNGTSKTAKTNSPGLTIPRRYTQPGQNVWATVEWELRTASIVGSDGTVVFEQKGVEIPKAWSQLATNVVVSKYFRGQIGTLEREYSVKQLIGRVSDRILEWGRQGGYFASDADADAFHDELRYTLLHQYAAFNSPVWFNLGWAGRRQAVSACYINEVDDTMESILDLYKTEGMLFKDGSGSGLNLSTLRSSKEPLEAGGRSSGPISFMKGLDASAGSIKSGGSTRRAACMRVLDIDHPDVKEFIDCKKDAEEKAHALIDAGYSGAFNVAGGAYDTVPFQNANHSVRVTDDFMQAVEADAAWDTKFRLSGKSAQTYRARDLMRGIAEGTWVCGDPGMQYDTTINDWHTCANTDRIYASNPCVTGDTLVATSEGWQRIDSLVGQSARIIGADGQPHFVDRIFPTGHKPVFNLRTRAGFEVTITGNHQVLTTERGDVAVEDLRLGEHVQLEGAGFGRRALNESLALAIGVAVGDGCLSRQNIRGREQEYVVLTMSESEAPILEKMAVELNHQKDILRASGLCGHPGAASVVPQSTPGTSRLTVGSAPVVELFKEFAVLDKGSNAKQFTPAAYELDRPTLATVLRGLFTADGTVANYGDKSQYVSLDSTSKDLLQQVQMLLLSFGIKSKIYLERRGGKTEAMLPNSAREPQSYTVQETHSLRISKASRVIFEREIGFDPASAKSARLRDMNLAFTTYKDMLADEIVSITEAGTADVYDLTEAVTHHFVANGLVVHNCSEYMFLNSTACNLSSLNLMKFRQEGTGAFDTDSFEHAVRLMLTAQEIVVGFASYPTPKIEQRSHEYRTLGLGYANLGALLMAAGLPYDSDAGRAYAGAVTALMTGRAYHQSAAIARDCGGPFSGFAENRDPMLRVMHKHRDQVDQINGALIPDTLLAAVRTAWDETISLGESHGYRNAQSTVLAPTGTIGFLMDCDTTGIEPDIAIVKYKSLVGGGMMKIVNQTVPEALERLGYDEAQAEGIIKFIDEHDTIEGAPDLRPEHLPIFDCAFRPMNGTRSIHYRGHIKMMAAAQPFISGAISKTVNVPNDATPEDIAETYLESWKLGIKAVAIYRDGSKRTQPLNTSKEAPAKEKIAPATEAAVPAAPLAPPKAVRRRLPDERAGVTHKFSIGGHEGYLTVGLYPDTNQPGEIFIRMSKEGSSISGLMDSFATAISLALQYGVPLSTLVDKFIHSRFEPSGFTGNKEIPMAKSVMDYIFRYLALRFLQKEDRHNVGLLADQDDSAYAPAKLPAPPAHDAKSGSLSNGNGKNGNGNGSKSGGDLAHLAETNTAAITDHEREIYRMQSDAPPCPECGAITIRSGACYKCLSCGTSLGCS
jgi:ribonucleoside-diphosphate reductase alpha chain